VILKIIRKVMQNFLLLNMSSSNLLFTVRSILADAIPQGKDSPKAEQSLPVNEQDKCKRIVALLTAAGTELCSLLAECIQH
jgi:hypothetical protein